MSAFYRERHPDGPFTTLITYRCLDATDDLINQAGHPNPTTTTFKADLQQALADPNQLPGDELSHALDYGDRCEEAFVRRLWHDLYGEQPAGGADPHRAVDAVYYERPGRTAVRPAHQPQ